MNEPTDVRNELASKWWLFMLDGCILVLMGVLLIFTQLNGAIAFIEIVGYLLIFGAILGVFALAQEASAGASLAARWFMPIIACGIGIVLIVDPGQSLQALVMIIGIATLVVGAVQLAAGLGFVGHPSRGLLIGLGILSLIAGMLMLLFPLVAAWVLSIFFGVQFLFCGFVRLAAAAHMRKLAT